MEGPIKATNSAASTAAPGSLINPFMSRASPAAKAAGWSVGAAAAAGGAYLLLQRPASRANQGGDDRSRQDTSTSAPSTSEDSATGMQASTKTAQHMVLAAAGLSGLLGVACGAFGFHGLKRVIAHRGQSVPELVQFWQIATQYQLLHTAALVATAALPDRSALPAAAGFLGGITLFSGSIYAYVLTGRKAFQYLTPFGGLSFMAGWGALTLLHGHAAIQTGAA